MRTPRTTQRQLKVGVPPLGGHAGVARHTQPPKGGTPTPANRTKAKRSTFNPRCLKAFSLIEVVIAVAIFGMAATVLMSAFVSALLARERGVSIDLLNADIRAVRMQLLLEPNLDDAEDGDEYETLNSGEASWQAMIEPTNVVDLFQVQLSINFSESLEDLPTEHVETLYLLRPTWSESGERSDLLQEKREALKDTRSNYDF
ncbi:MAG: prepilin-type N-terminal cleavage/methylation domain-containing protein [Candidatus Azotimanducaceae bacterium]